MVTANRYHRKIYWASVAVCLIAVGLFAWTGPRYMIPDRDISGRIC